MSDEWKAAEASALCARAEEIAGDDPAGARFALTRALELWPECAAAREALAALDAELSQAAKPLGTLLLVAGVLGGIGAISAGYSIRNHPELATPGNKFMGWAAILVVVGIVGLIQFRKADLSERALSTQTLGVWGFVGLAGILTQVIGAMLHLGPYALIPVTSLLIGIGFATFAFQAGRWLVVPALACFGVALALAALPAYSREILGSMLIVVMGGTGLALRLGAPLR